VFPGGAAPKTMTSWSLLDLMVTSLRLADDITAAARGRAAASQADPDRALSNRRSWRQFAANGQRHPVD
jgi:hypothetical protein